MKVSTALDRVAVLLALALTTLRTTPDNAQHYISNAAQIVQGLRETREPK